MAAKVGMILPMLGFLATSQKRPVLSLASVSGCGQLSLQQPEA
jgi:hypothetical protein